MVEGSVNCGWATFTFLEKDAARLRILLENMPSNFLCLAARHDNNEKKKK
jgi:hypothetical protein